MTWIVQYPQKTYYAATRAAVAATAISYARTAFRTSANDKEPVPPDIGPEELVLLHDCPTKKQLEDVWRNYEQQMNVRALKAEAAALAKVAIRLKDPDMAMHALRMILVFPQVTKIQAIQEALQKKVGKSKVARSTQEAFEDFCRRRHMKPAGLIHGIQSGRVVLPVFAARKGSRTTMYKAVCSGRYRWFIVLAKSAK